MGVSKNNGTPKSSISIGFSITFTIHFGWFSPYFSKTYIYIYTPYMGIIIPTSSVSIESPSNFSPSSWIWMANSRVGAITNNDGSPEAAPMPRDNMSVKAGSLRGSVWEGLVGGIYGEKEGGRFTYFSEKKKQINHWSR